MPTKDIEKTPLSVVIIAKNEEKRLGDCIQSVAWAKEVIVIDDDSTDKTVELAQGLGAKVIRRTMDIEGRQRNFSFDQATQPWILTIDADERVTPGLGEEIARETAKHAADETVTGFAVPIKTFIGTRWIKGAGYYPARKTRLFKKGRFRYEEALVHPRALYEGKILELNGDILHYSCENLGQFISKFNRETSLEAEKWILDKRKVSLAKALRKTFDRFLKNYFLKGGMRDGLMGYVMSLFHGLYQLISYAKYREMKNARVIFVDRDGVINEDLFDYVKDWKDFRFNPGVLEGLRRLYDQHYKIVLISNQAGVGDGHFTEDLHWKIHQKMLEAFEASGVQLHGAFYCLHGKNAGCDCRKPKSGLFRKANQNGIVFDKSRTFFLGDKASDIESGKNFGLRTILIRTGYGHEHESLCTGNLTPDFVVDDFRQAVERVLCG